MDDIGLSVVMMMDSSLEYIARYRGKWSSHSWCFQHPGWYTTLPQNNKLNKFNFQRKKHLPAHFSFGC
jgi:hypothetical protein